MGNGEEEQMIIGWKAIAAEFHVNESSLKTKLRRVGLCLPKLHSRGRTGPVYAFRSTIMLLRAQLFRFNVDRPRMP